MGDGGETVGRGPGDRVGRGWGECRGEEGRREWSVCKQRLRILELAAALFYSKCLSTTSQYDLTVSTISLYDLTVSTISQYDLTVSTITQ